MGELRFGPEGLVGSLARVVNSSMTCWTCDTKKKTKSYESGVYLTIAETYVFDGAMLGAVLLGAQLEGALEVGETLSAAVHAEEQHTKTDEDRRDVELRHYVLIWVKWNENTTNTFTKYTTDNKTERNVRDRDRRWFR